MRYLDGLFWPRSSRQTPVPNRMRAFAISLLLGSVLAACASATHGPSEVTADIAWVSEGEYCEPETVLPLPDGTLLVSNVCGLASMGDGFLSLLDATGHMIEWRRVDGLDSPLGMALSDGQIYVVDANRIKSFAWPGFSALNEITLETKVANDIAVSPDGYLYISDTGAGRVTVLAPDGTPVERLSRTSFSGANGVEMGPDGALYIGGEHLWRVDLATGDVERFGPDWISDIDGIEFEPDGTLQVTPVGGPLIRLLKSGQIDVIGGEGVSSANHGYAANTGLALIPTGYDNTVIAIQIPDADEAKQ